jgi:hypothetical protein
VVGSRLEKETVCIHYPHRLLASQGVHTEKRGEIVVEAMALETEPEAW